MNNNNDKQNPWEKVSAKYDVCKSSYIGKQPFKGGIWNIVGYKHTIGLWYWLIYN